MANLLVNIGANIDALKAQLGKAESQLQGFSKKSIAIGKSLSLAVTAPLVGLAAIGINNFDKQIQAIGQIEASLKSTGNAANKTSEELQKTASRLQEISTFGDEEILQKVTAQLLTFTNISGDAFDRTQKAALDLATRLGGDLQGAAIQLGKALNDPVANLSALSRSGIQFSEAQKGLIKSLVETNRLSEAQTIILDELEKQYGGSAEAAAKLGLGPLKQLQNQFGDLLEDVGKVILEGFLPLIKIAKDVISFFQGLSDQTKKTIVIIAGLVAAIGPLLIGIGGIIQILPILAAGLAALTGPVGLVVAAVAAAATLIILNFEEIKRNLQILALEFISVAIDIVKGLNIISNAIPGFKATTTAAIFGLENLGKSIAKNIAEGLSTDGVKGVNEFEDSLKGLNTTLQTTGTLIGGLNRTDEVAISGGQDRSGVFGNFVNVEDSGITLPAVNGQVFIDSLAGIKQQVEEILIFGIENTIGNFAFAVGESIANGANALQAGASAIIGSFGGILDELGKTALQTGILALGIGKAIEGIKKALTTLSGPVAIIAGAALIALAGFARATAGRIGGGASGVGGGASGVGSGVPSTFEGSGNDFISNQVNLSLVPEITGDAIRFVLDKSNDYRN
jgi:hypothetical protein